MEVSFAGKNLTLADIRKASKKVIQTEATSELKVGGLGTVVEDVKNDFALRDMARAFARQESPNIARQFRTDILVTGGQTKKLQAMKGDLEVCDEWAPWSEIFRLQNK